MTGFGGLLSRHCRIAFRYPAALFFLLFPIAVAAVLFVVYLFPLHSAAVAVPSAGAGQIRWLAVSWAAAGIPVVLAFPTAMIALQVFASDRSAGRRRDFSATLLGGERRRSPTSGFRWQPHFLYLCSPMRWFRVRPHSGPV
jgi:hypothetical protein